MKTTLTNVLSIDKIAKILGLRLWTKLDSQQPVIDRSTVAQTDPIPPYDESLILMRLKFSLSIGCDLLEIDGFIQSSPHRSHTESRRSNRA